MEIIEDAAGVFGREVLPRIIAVPSPAAGAEWKLDIPGGVAWYIRSAFARLTASAVVANRNPSLSVLESDSHPIFTSPQSLATAATFITDYTWSPYISVPGGLAGFWGQAPFMHGPLLTGWRISTVTAGFDVGDSWSSIFLYVLEVWERPYDVELDRDTAQLRGSTSNAFPSVKESL